MKPEEKYPLPEDERSLLVGEVLRTDGILLILGIILAIVYTGASSGDWYWNLVYCGWGFNLGQALTLGSHPLATIGFALAIPLASSAVALLVHKVLWPRSESYKADTYEIRAGVNGELPRLSLPHLAGLSLLVGFAEEFAFRYGLILVLTVFFGQFVVEPSPVVIAVAISAVLFTLIHAQYGKAWERLVVAAIALAFGCLFVWSGSLLAVAFSHALYDFLELLIERRRMMTDDAYFGEAGAPKRVMGDLYDQILSNFDDDE